MFEFGYAKARTLVRVYGDMLGLGKGARVPSINSLFFSRNGVSQLSGHTLIPPALTLALSSLLSLSFCWSCKLVSVVTKTSIIGCFKLVSSHWN